MELLGKQFIRHKVRSVGLILFDLSEYSMDNTVQFKFQPQLDIPVLILIISELNRTFLQLELLNHK